MFTREPPPLKVDGALAAGTLVWERTPGEMLCTVIAKTTYALTPGECELSAAPLPILTDDVHWFDDARRSVSRPSDWAPRKAACDVTLSGSAYAPSGEDRSSVSVRLVVGSVDKTIEAWCPRSLSAEGELVLHGGQRVFPLAWEFAAGQGDTDNPVGVDCANGRLPSLQPSGFSPSRASDPPPASFGPISPHWPSRRRLLRQEAMTWVANGFAGLMPSELDVRWFQVSPADQRIEGALPPDAAMLLEGIDPSRPRFVTRLAGVEPRLYLWTPHERVQRMTADGLHIDTDRRDVTVTWRSTFPIRRGIVATVTLVGAGESLDGARIRRLRDLHDDAAPRSVDLESTAAELSAFTAPALPFREGVAAPATHAEQAPPEVVMQPALAPPIAPPPPAMQSSSWATSAPATAHVVPPIAAPRAAPLPPLPPAPMPPAPMPPAPMPPAPVFAGAASTPLPASSPVARSEGDVQRPRAWRPDQRPGTAGEITPSEEPAPGRGHRLAGARRPRASAEPVMRRALVDLLTFHDKALPRIARDPHMREILHQASTRPQRAMDTPRLAAEPASTEREHLQMLRLLSSAPPVDAANVRDVVRERLSSPEAFELPLLVLEGELHVSFDELEHLRTTVAITKPLAAADKRVLPLVQHAESQLEGGGARLGGEVAMSLARQLEAASAQLALTPRFVEKATLRALLEERKYRRRELFGETVLRMELPLGRAGRIPAYVPAAVATRLPLLPSFDAIVLGELRPREDAFEAEKDCFLVLALGRRMDAEREA